MLHGYTQSGPLFHAKTRALEKHLQKALSPSLAPSVQLTYPTRPLPLNPSDIPGFSASTPSSDPPESFAWWRRSNTAEPPEYVGLDNGLSAIARTLADSGPFDGVVGFSQGAALAAMVASLLEKPAREAAFAHFSSSNPLGIPYPPSFATLSHPPLKFAICYSGFRAPGPRYRGFYEGPGISTPALHFLGSLDGVVEEARSMALVGAWEGGGKEMVVWHPGGHFLPSQKVYLDRVALFIRECVEGRGIEEGKGAQEEEGVEDMDVPF
jgi:hypothetical protein